MFARPHTLGTLYRLWRHPHVAREDIVSFQNARLRRLVRHAYENVPYYRNLLDRHGLNPADIQSVADLSAIPITSKRDLQALPAADVVARGVDPRRLITRTSSGSSGEPFSIRRTRWETRLSQASRLRAMHDFGLRPTDTVASVVMRKPPDPNDSQLLVRLLRSLGVYRHELVSCFLPPDEILRELRQISPDVLGGLAGVLSRLAQVVHDHDRPAIRPRFVAVGGDVLTPFMRRQIVEAFAAPVFELYTSIECGTAAWECGETGAFHTCDDCVIVEVLEDGRPVGEGERGEVVVTNLHAFAMPLIRYRLGDIVTKGAETCRCGRPFATIQAVQGRMIDYFPLPGGRMLHPYEIVVVILRETAPWMRAYRLLQERRDRIVLNAVASVAPSQAQLLVLHAAVTRVLGPEVEFDVQLVDDMHLERTGKFRASRSLVRSAYDGIDWTSDTSR